MASEKEPLTQEDLAEITAMTPDQIVSLMGGLAGMLRIRVGSKTAAGLLRKLAAKFDPQ